MAKRRKADEDDEDDYDLMEEEERPTKKAKGLDPGLEYTLVSGCFLLTLIGMLLAMLL